MNSRPPGDFGNCRGPEGDGWEAVGMGRERGLERPHAYPLPPPQEPHRHPAIGSKVGASAPKLGQAYGGVGDPAIAWGREAWNQSVPGVLRNPDDTEGVHT